jgi:hypothetical protein
MRETIARLLPLLPARAEVGVSVAVGGAGAAVPVAVGVSVGVEVVVGVDGAETISAPSWMMSTGITDGSANGSSGTSTRITLVR